jgi:hypothetical protein
MKTSMLYESHRRNNGKRGGVCAHKLQGDDGHERDDGNCGVSIAAVRRLLCKYYDGSTGKDTIRYRIK